MRASWFLTLVNVVSPDHSSVNFQCWKLSAKSFWELIEINGDLQNCRLGYNTELFCNWGKNILQHYLLVKPIGFKAHQCP